MPEQDAVQFGWRIAHGAGSVVERMQWYVNRLKCMTGAEVLHRVLRTVTNQGERWGLGGATYVPAPDLKRESRPWIHVPTDVDPVPHLQAADRIAAGYYDVFAMQGVELGSPPRWNRDPKTGIEAPLRFGKLLNYRDPRLVGDIKYLWEPNRHHHLVTLAQAYVFSGNARYCEVIRRHLEDWFDACPYPMGPNWSSALESALRLINWSVAWQLLGGASSRLFEGEAGIRFRKRWLDSVFQHAHFVAGFFSLHSSANNHLIGEAAGLFIAAVTWPLWPHANAWRNRSRAILEREALQQNGPDGVNREQAVSYQRFELDLLLFSRFAAKANGLNFPAAFDSRIEAMIEYLAAIMDTGGNVPMIGDSDDGKVVELAQGPGYCGYRSLLATGALLFRRGDFKRKAGGLDERTRWLFGAGAVPAFAELKADEPQSPAGRAFPDGGYYVLGCDFGTDDEIRLVADAGPLGYRTIAAHGHADALAFTLSVGGVEFLVDPGTYAYHTQGPWRQYFRGTSAHNTIRIDGKDQSQPGGNFMWIRKANAGCSRWQSNGERDLFEGWHDGYTHLSDPVLHRRRITFEKRPRRIVIEDTLLMSKTHEIELYFHCGEQCRIGLSPQGYSLSQKGRTLSLRLPESETASARIHYGSIAPILGWISRGFDRKRPAPTIAWRARIKGDAVLRSEIAC